MENNLYNVNVSSNSIEEQRMKFKNTENGEMTKRFNFDVKNYLNVRLANNEKQKKVRIRILNSTPSSTTPFLVVKTHSIKVDREVSKSGFKEFQCLNDENVFENTRGNCPLCQKSKELFEQANMCTDPDEKKALIKKAYSFKSKTTYILRVIDRDHEEDGVKFWKFNSRNDGQGCYDMLMSIYDERMKENIAAGYGNYNVFDLNNGKDFILTITAVQNTSKTSISIVDAGIATPLSNDYDKAMSWINDKKTWRDVYTVKNEDYLRVIADGGVPKFDKELGRYVNSSIVPNTDTQSQQSTMIPTQMNGQNEYNPYNSQINYQQDSGFYQQTNNQPFQQELNY